MGELLSYQEVEEALESILVNKKLVEVRSARGPIFLFFSHPTTEETLMSRQVRRRCLLAAQAEGLPSREQIEEIVKQRNIVPQEEQDRVKELDAKIAAQNRLLQITKIEGRRKPIKDAIRALQAEIAEIHSKTNSFFYMSAETKADEELILYLTWVSTYDLNGKRRWDSFDHFENETDLYFRSNLIDSFNEFNRGLSTKVIRFLARHNLWRIRYSAAIRIGGSLFCRELYDLTPDQLSLIYWTDYYQSIYEMMPDERPDPDTIQDDEALDAYMESVVKRREAERNENKVKRHGGDGKKGKLSAWDRSDELIITAAHPNYLGMTYSEKRIQAPEGAADVEVISPHSRRARNRA